MDHELDHQMLGRRHFLSLGGQAAALGVASALLPMPLLAKAATKYPTVRKNGTRPLVTSDRF